MPLEYILTNPFLEKIYRELKKLSKLFQISIKLYWKMVYYCVPLGHTIVKCIKKNIIIDVEFMVK